MSAFIWIIACVVLVIIEVVSQMIWTLCLAAGCLCGAIASFCGAETAWQIAIVALGTVAAFPVLMPIFKHWHKVRRERHDDRTGMDALLGRRGVVTEEIRPEKLGRVRIDGDNWQARIPGNPETVRAGRQVVVTAYDSIILTVEPTK